MGATYPTCLDTADDATACAFFWTGLALGILHVDASKEWAYARIDARDAPTIEIIEDDERVLMANGIFGTAAGFEADLVEALERYSCTA